MAAGTTPVMSYLPPRTVRPGLALLVIALLVPSMAYGALAEGAGGPAEVPAAGGGGIRGNGTDAPPPTIHFAASADQHYGILKEPVPRYDDDTVDDWMTHPDLPELDFVIASMGDIMSHRRAPLEWQDTRHCWKTAVKRNFDHQRLPYFWVMGNHDITNYDDMIDGNPVRKERFGRAASGMNENNYAFMYGNVLFICAAQTNTMFHLSNFQKGWMEYLLERYSDHTTVILAHQATQNTTGSGSERASTWGNNDYRVHNDVKWWEGMFAGNPQVKLYIHGHTECGHNTTAHDLLERESWDDHCTFVLVPGNGKGYLYHQEGWSYIFSMSDDSLVVRLWDSFNHTYVENVEAAVPYVRSGMSNNVTGGGMGWYSVPKRVLDGQTWEWRNHMVSRSYGLELVGSDRTEQLDNADLSGCFDRNESGSGKFRAYWYAVEGDEAALNLLGGERDGFIMVEGGQTLGLSTWASNDGLAIEGKVPYNTAVAVPGGTYIFSCEMRTGGSIGTANITVTIPRYLDLNDTVWLDHPVGQGLRVDPALRRYSAEFTVPDEPDCWFIKPRVHLGPGAVYMLHSWSLVMKPEGDSTGDFTAHVNGVRFNTSGVLLPGEQACFTLPNTLMNNRLSFNVSIGGNRVGLLRLIHREPQLWSDDVSFGIRNTDQGLVHLKDVSHFNTATTVMSFKGATMGMEGFTRKNYRGKYCYLHDGCDHLLDGMYRVNLASGVPPPGSGTFVDRGPGDGNEPDEDWEAWLASPARAMALEEAEKKARAGEAGTGPGTVGGPPADLPPGRAYLVILSAVSVFAVPALGTPAVLVLAGWAGNRSSRGDRGGKGEAGRGSEEAGV